MNQPYREARGAKLKTANYHRARYSSLLLNWVEGLISKVGGLRGKTRLTGGCVYRIE
jgi:hypothetical protein